MRAGKSILAMGAWTVLSGALLSSTTLVASADAQELYRRPSLENREAMAETPTGFSLSRS
jgi:hypothetical protein